MYRIKFILLITLFLFIFACDKKTDENIESSENSTTATDVIENVIDKITDDADIEKLKEENVKLLNEMILKDDEISRLKASISTNEATISNMEETINSQSSTRKVLIYFQIISVILNILLIILLVKPKKLQKRLALPIGRNKESNKNNESQKQDKQVAKDDTSNVTTTNDDATVSENPQQSKKRGRPSKEKDTSTDDKNNTTKRRGRPKKDS